MIESNIKLKDGKTISIFFDKRTLKERLKHKDQFDDPIQEVLSCLWEVLPNNSRKSIENLSNDIKVDILKAIMPRADQYSSSLNGLIEDFESELNNNSDFYPNSSISQRVKGKTLEMYFDEGNYSFIIQSINDSNMHLPLTSEGQQLETLDDVIDFVLSSDNPNKYLICNRLLNQAVIEGKLIKNDPVQIENDIYNNLLKKEKRIYNMS